MLNLTSFFSPAQHAQLLRLLSEVTWEELYNAPDVQTAFDLYYEILLKFYDTVYPLKTITLSNCDPKFITPHIKSLLRLRNRLMHRGRTQEADYHRPDQPQNHKNKCSQTFVGWSGW